MKIAYISLIAGLYLLFATSCADTPEENNNNTCQPAPKSEFCFRQCGSHTSEGLCEAERTEDCGPCLEVKASKIATNFAHTCSILNENKTYCWGNERFGKLGNRTFGVMPAGLRPIPGEVFTISLKFESIWVGRSHTCAITNKGETYCWGTSGNGRLGNQDMSGNSLSIPQLVAGDVAFVQLALGRSHSCGLSEKGEIYCWGKGVDDGAGPSMGQLGFGSERPGNTDAPKMVLKPELKWSSIMSNHSYSCALTEDGDAYCWGDNRYGALGDGTQNNKFEPTAVSGGLKFSKIAVGKDHTCAITKKIEGNNAQNAGEVYCWGDNEAGQLSIDQSVTKIKKEPHKVVFSDTVEIKEIAVNGEYFDDNGDYSSAFSCALTQKGDIYCWGSNSHHQLARTLDDDALYDFNPKKINLPSGEESLKFESLSAGINWVCAFTEQYKDSQSDLYCWGSNSDGQLGVEINDNQKLQYPVKVEFP